jgi:hypothetical protein
MLLAGGTGELEGDAKGAGLTERSCWLMVKSA